MRQAQPPLASSTHHSASHRATCSEFYLSSVLTSTPVEARHFVQSIS
jgi:hypothetical protein